MSDNFGYTKFWSWTNYLFDNGRCNRNVKTTIQNDSLIVVNKIHLASSSQQPVLPPAWPEGSAALLVMHGTLGVFPPRPARDTRENMKAGFEGGFIHEEQGEGVGAERLPRANRRISMMWTKPDNMLENTLVFVYSDKNGDSLNLSITFSDTKFPLGSH